MHDPAPGRHIRVAVFSAQGQLCSRKSVSGQTSRMDRFVGILRAKFIDILVVPEPGCQLFQARAALQNSAWAEHGVQAFGPSNEKLKVLALVSKRITAGIQGVGTAIGGRLVHLRWATGRDQLQVACVYSKAGAMQDGDKLAEAIKLLRALKRAAEKAAEKGRQFIAAGDFNLVLREEDGGVSTSERSIEEFRTACTQARLR